MKSLFALTVLLLALPFSARAGLENDKELHLAAGTLIYTMLALPSGEPWLGLAGVTAAGAAKEVLDSFEQGNRFDPADLAATVAGGAGAYALHQGVLFLWARFAAEAPPADLPLLKVRPERGGGAVILEFPLE